MIIQPTIIDSDEWAPASDWIQLPSVANNEILLLVSDILAYYSFVVTVTGGYTVDWGDGTVTNYASIATATHTYTVGTGQSCSRGYTTFKVRIYAQTPADSITQFKIGATASLKQRYNGILWAKLGTTGLTSLSFAFYNGSGSGGAMYSSYMECLELPISLTSCTNYSYMVYNAFGLQKVIMPYSYSSSSISFQSTFMVCHNLKRLNFNVTSLNVSSFSSCFYNNYSIKKIILPSIINNCTSFTSFLQNCGSLHSINIPDINTNCIANSMFINCNAIEEIIFPSSWNNRITNYSNAHNGNYSLKKLVLPSNMPSLVIAGLSSAFTGCWRLEQLTLPSDLPSNLTELTNLFQTNYNLKTVTNFPALNSATVYSFNNCSNLSSISNLDQLGDTTTSFDHTSTFVNCYSLTSLSCRNKITGRFVLAGSTSITAALTALLFTNPGAVSTWAGASPQIDVSYCSMDATALNALFTSIITTSASFSGKTIRITGNPGANTCDTTIITAVGGTVNKTT